MKRTNDKNQPSENSILEAMQQNWLHARHLENQRLTFTNLYAAIVAAVLAFMGQNGIDKNVYLVWFLLIFSIFGLMVVLKTNHEYGHHMRSKISGDASIRGRVRFSDCVSQRQIYLENNQSTICISRILYFDFLHVDLFVAYKIIIILLVVS
jgi:hypothetical protein